jgi:hypothetical protein
MYPGYHLRVEIIAIEVTSLSSFLAVFISFSRSKITLVVLFLLCLKPIAKARNPSTVTIRFISLCQNIDAATRKIDLENIYPTNIISYKSSDL